MNKPTLEEKHLMMPPTYAPEIVCEEIKPITTFELGLPDTIEKVTIKMGGRTVEFDVNKFMDMLESFKNDFCVEKKQWEIKVD